MSKFTLVCFIAAVLAGTSAGRAQQSASQSFRLHIPNELSLNSVRDFAAITHDLSENDQQFPWQLWWVVNRNAAGGVITFRTDRAFTNTSVSSAKRDVRLDLKKRRAPRWKITQKRDQTDYKAGDETAVVRAESDRPGAGIFRLRVTFIEESLTTLEAGDYEIKVVGTLVPK